MAASVQVLCPNGRRQTVKVTPNTKLLQVLEEVCQRQGFIPPEDFKLIQGRKDLDLSLSFRFSSLPNNAKLELARSETARVEQEVIIALQLDSGQRLQDKFLPSISLWDLLLQFEEKNGDHKGRLTNAEVDQGKSLHPVCIFMREEVIGEQALKATTLKKLALTSGKAIIRLVHRPVEETLIANISDQVEKDKAKQAKLEEIALKKKEMLDEREREESLKSSSDERSLYQLEEEQDRISGSGEDSHQQWHQPQPHQRQQQGLRHEQGQDEEMEVDRSVDDATLSSTQSLTEDSSASQISPIKVASPPTTSRQQPSPMQELRDLNIPGVEIFTPDDFNDLNPQEQAIARRLAQRFLPHLQGSSTASPMQANVRPGASDHLTDEQSSNAFLDFKFPEETKGKDLSTNEGRSSRHSASVPCERNPLVYDASETLPVSSKDLPDSFFDVTQSDVRLLYRDLQTAVQKMDEQPLMTKTMKQALAESAYDHYERVIIRVHFPDKLVLQACFRPRETVGALHSFVKDCLQEKHLKFYLYTTPPKTVLKDMKLSLAVSQLAPAALVYFGCNEERDHYIKQGLLTSLSPRLEAESRVAQILNQGDIESPHPSSGTSSEHNLSRPGPSGTSGAGRASSYPSSSSSPATLPSGAKVPNWLKLGKK